MNSDLMSFTDRHMIMIRYLVCLLMVLPSCLLSSQTATEVSMHLKSYEIEDYNIIFVLEISNDSQDTISILTGRPIKISGNRPPREIFPHFFSIDYKGDQEPCMVSSPSEEGLGWIPSRKHFRSILPNQKREVELWLNDYEGYYCGDRDFELKIEYQYQTELDDQAIFDQRLKSITGLKNGSPVIFNLMKNTYRHKLSTTLIHKVDSPSNDVVLIVDRFETADWSNIVDGHIVNNTDSTIHILNLTNRSNGATRKLNQRPEFFNFSVDPQVKCTMSKPYSDVESSMKSTIDIIDIAPDRNGYIRLISGYQDLLSCGRQGTFRLSYQHDDRFDSRTYFDNQIKIHSNIDQHYFDSMYRRLLDCYRQPLAVTLTIE